jgi:N-formylglutamate amidohydrolase
VRIVSDFLSTPAFELTWPERLAAPILVDSPHSGRAYPDAFLRQTRLDARAIRRSEDAFVDELCRPAVDLGAALLTAEFPRAYLDVNREPLELDPRMFVGRLPAGANTGSTRVAGGLGTIPRIVSEREEIYGGPIPVEEALERISSLYEPYHATLGWALEEMRARFGVAMLIDCHSMPSGLRVSGGEGRADIVLGDRNGTSCTSALTDMVSVMLRAAGYRVTRNKPYAGGYITEHYGRPVAGVHALQIEISRGLYMNETTMRKTGGFETLRRDLARVFSELVAGWGAIIDSDALAAE